MPRKPNAKGVAKNSDNQSVPTPQDANARDVIKMALAVAKSQVDAPAKPGDANISEAITQVWGTLKTRLGNSPDAVELDRLIQQLSKK